MREIVAVSVEGRAAKNDAALFALAMAAAAPDEATRRAALEALPQVARIGKATGLRGPGNRWLGGKTGSPGYEDICYDEHGGHFYLVIEAMKDKHGEWASAVDE